MTKTELLRLQLRSARLSFIDRLRDLGNLAFPIFVTSGLLVACFKFWIWVFA